MIIVKKVMNTLLNRIISIIGLTIVCLWVSLFVSYKKIEPPLSWDGDINSIPFVATGGFPFRAFEYPIPPLGNDFPPQDSWLPFFYNFIFWLITINMIMLITSRKIRLNLFTSTLFMVAAFFFTFLGFVYLMIQYD